MLQEIKKFVLACDLCQRVKCPNRKTIGAFGNVESSGPGDLVSVDFFGPLPRSQGGVEYIFVRLDVFSKYVKLYPIKRETTDTILNKTFNCYIPEMANPTRILSDHGTQFTSPKWGERLRQEGIKAIFSSIRHPQSNPVERVMRELGRLFRTLCADRHTRWAKCISDIEFFFNITMHLSTGFSPCELHIGRKPTDRILDILRFPESIQPSGDMKIMIARDRLTKSFERRARSQGPASGALFSERDWVLLRVPKLSDAMARVTMKFFYLFYGPYQVARSFGNNSYELADVNDAHRILGTYNQCHLKKYIKPE